MKWRYSKGQAVERTAGSRDACPSSMRGQVVERETGVFLRNTTRYVRSANINGARCVSKGQAATESLVLLGFIIALSIPVALLLFANANIQSENVAVTQAKISTRAIVDSANEVWAQGDGASRVVLVNYPSKLLGINVSEREVTFVLDSSQGGMEVSALGFANMSDGRNNGLDRLDGDRTAGATYINSGLHDINITNNGTNIVVTYVQ